MNAGAGLGLAIIVISEACTLARIEPFWSWNTPICWTGFIIFADAIVHRARGSSWLSSSPREFVFLAVLSIPLWLVFELYNLVIRNWYYIGLPQNAMVRNLGYAWSFATISPALFEAAELIAVWRGTDRAALGSSYFVAASHRGNALQPPTAGWRYLSILLGAAMLVSPFLVSPAAAQYLAAPVWLGFIFVLDPINDRLGFDAIIGDWRHGRMDRLVNLLLSGLVCGLLWEFWNYWSRTKWHYAVPIMPNVRLFEMPLPGFLGFPPFAVECFDMYVFVRGVAAKMAGMRPGPHRHLGRSIGL